MKQGENGQILAGRNPGQRGEGSTRSASFCLPCTSPPPQGNHSPAEIRSWKGLPGLPGLQVCSEQGYLAPASHHHSPFPGHRVWSRNEHVTQNEHLELYSVQPKNWHCLMAHGVGSMQIRDHKQLSFMPLGENSSKGENEAKP